MKRFQGDTATSENSSCTSYFYTSESDRLSLRRLRAQRSRINRLFRENYIPSKEIKLIDKLVKTRVLYDDVRNQLLSGSSISVNEKAVLKPMKFTPDMGEELEEAERSSDIFAMIDLVDKGIVLGPRKLSQCCSCCSVKTRYHQYAKKVRRQKSAFTGGCTKANSSVISSDTTKNNNRLETKNIKSEPCTCTSKLEELIKLQSKSLLQKNQPLQTTLITEPTFLGFYPIEEHKLQSNKTWHYKSKRSGVHAQKKSEGEIIGPATKLQQSSSNKGRHIDTLKNIENKKKVKHLDKDIQSRLNKSILNIVENCPLQNIPTDNILHVKKHYVAKYENLFTKLLAEEHLNLGIDEPKIKYLNGTQTLQNTSNLSDVEAKTYLDAIPIKIKNHKYRIVTRCRKNPIKTEKLTAQSKTNLQHINSYNLTWNDNNAGIKNKVSSGRKQQCHNKNPTIRISKRCCTLKLKPVNQKSKSTRDTQASMSSKHSCSVQSKTSSEPNISSRRGLKQYPIKTSKASGYFHVKSKSLHSIRQVEQTFAPLQTPVNVETITKPDRQQILDMGTSYDIYPSNLTKANIDNNFPEYDHITEAMKLVRRDSDNEMVARHKLSQVSSSTPKSRHSGIQHKLRRCLCKLKLIRPKNKTVKQMSIPIEAHSIHQSDSKSYLRRRYEEIQRSYLPWKYICNDPCVHKVEPETIYEKKYRIRSGLAIKPKSVAPVRKRKVLSRLKSHKSEAPHRILPRKPRCEVKSLCDIHLQAEIDTSLAMNFERQHIKRFSSTGHDVPFIIRKTHAIHKKKSSTIHILQENTEQKQKLAMIKIEKHEKCFLLGPERKRCMCTLKLHKEGRIAINHNTGGIGTFDTIKENIYPDLEKLKECLKGEERTMFSTEGDLPKESNRPTFIKPHLQEKNTATDFKQISKKSQVKIKTCDKAFGVTPKLKRCFCTLQFLKKDEAKKKKMCTCVKAGPYVNYNVRTPKMILPNKDQVLFMSNNSTKAQNLANQWCHLNDKSSSSTFSISSVKYNPKTMQSYFRKSEIKLLRLDSENADNLSSQKILRFESKLSFEVNCLRNTFMTNENNVDSYTLLDSRSNENGYHFSQCNMKLDTTPSRVTGIRPHLRRCYCAMNIQIANRGQIHTNKLKPYECEPGVCVPYECDPIECQKLIMKRLMKKSSTMTETKTFNSSSSSTAVAEGRTKKHQSSAAYETKKAAVKPIHLAHESVPQRQHFQSSGKQAVRLGSSFSFDVEFFKDTGSKKSPIKERKPSMSSRASRTNDKKMRAEGTRGMGYKQNDMESQSAVMKMRHRGSGVRPMVKRCFCTLKLQKKGRQQQKPLNINEQGTSTPTKMKIVPVAIEASQNTKPVKPVKVPKLLPYECEPGICVPGQCDPHACLELINKRLQKNKGTNSMRSNKTSSSSMTAKRKIQTKGKHIQSHKESHVRHTKPTHVVRSKPTKNTIEPSRQVVRIGSSFSFNVEFFKDHGPNSYQTPRQQKHDAREVKSGPRAKDEGSEGKRISLKSHDTQATLIKKEDKALGVGPMLKRCFCTLKLQKQKEPTKKTEQPKVLVANHSTRTPEQKPVADLYNRSVMTVNKSKPYGNKLLPYECEPGVCVPGSCDPYECEKRIKKRLMNRGSGTNQRETRSVSSSVKQKRKVKDSEVTVKQKKTKPTKEMKVKPMRSNVARPSRQVVRIGSNFSFNIDFYKDNSAGGTQESQPTSTPKKVPCSVECRKSPTAKSKKVQRVKTTRDMDSQILAKRMRSTMTEVTPFLKRCFCTLKLQQPEKVMTLEHKAVETKAQKNRDIPKICLENKCTKTKKNTIQSRKLEPYECEPGVCIPGECDPNECLKRIKKREMQSKQSGTERQKGHSVSSLASIQSKSQAKRTQIKTDAHKSAGDHKQRQRLTHSSSPQRQAVRIGSSFSFNIEFSKDTLPQSPCSSVCIPVCKPVCPKECPKTQDCKTTETKPKTTKTMSTLSGPKSESKGSGVKPALKRCFCTLKLQKIGNQQQNTKNKVEIAPKHMTTSTPITKPEFIVAGKEVGTKTKKEKATHNLEPYECEPGFCIPGQCDPHECLIRIKQRQTRNLGTETEGPPKRTMSSLTSPDKKNISKKTQKHKERPQRSPQPQPPRASRPSHRPPVEDRSRQAVRIGSNFSFNIEFYKDRTGSPVFRSPPQNKSLSSISTGNNTKYKNKGLSSRGKNNQHVKSQAAYVKTESRGSGMAPLLKRCFCTLALQNTTVHTKKNETKPIKKPTPKVTTESKTTSTKKKYDPPVKRMHLEPYECEPGVCIPGECDPYECLERIKKRGITRKSQTSEALNRSIKLQSNIKGPSKLDAQNESNMGHSKLNAHNESMIVEQPRFPLLLDRNKNRQVVRISSNFNFNIEFFKDLAPPTTGHDNFKQTGAPVQSYSKQTKCDKPCAVQAGSKSIKCDKKCGKCNNLQSCLSQSDPTKTENKASGVGKLLKRCFCTAKLVSPHGPRTVTVGRVENIASPFPFMRQDYWVQYQIPQSTTKNQDKRNAKKQHGQEKDSAEMKTILPYSPGRFNKKNSNSVIHNDMDITCSKKLCPGNDSPKKPNLKGAKRLTVKKSESDIIDDRVQTKVKKSALKQFVCRCMQIFSKIKDKPTKGLSIAPNNPTGTGVVPLKCDCLNPSKSERQSKVDDNNTSPKKTKSLKVTKVCDCKKADNKKSKFSKFQSGDDGQSQKTKQKKCPCQAKGNKEASKTKPPTKLVHFDLKSGDKNGLNLPTPPSGKTETNNANDSACIALCPCCGGFKIPKVDPKLNNTISPQRPNNNENRNRPNILQDRPPVTQNKNKSCSCVGRCRCPKSKSKKNKSCRCVGRCLCTKSGVTPGIQKDSVKKCVCGSKECSKEAEKLKKELSKKGKEKPKSSEPCVCGSKICRDIEQKSKLHKGHVCECATLLEHSKASAKKKMLAKKKEKDREKEKLLTSKKEKKALEKKQKEIAKTKQKAFAARQARYKKEDAARKKKRIQRDKQMLKDVKRQKNSGDAMLITESALDIAKLGFVSAGDIVRSVGKAAIDPKFTYRRIKSTLTEPSRACVKLKAVAEESPGISTFKRVKMRLQETTCVKKATGTLEKYPCTYYMLHMADKNPKKRMLKRPKNQRVKIDFQCSPYMLSLRKRPHLSVYLCCPWFYPHCISLLTVWRQFTDILLFLMAVAVWSPCIFCMEACRALMCCFLCTG